MPHHQNNSYARGIAMSAAGMVILSPDALLIRLVGHASLWDMLFYRTLFVFMALFAWLLVRHRSRIIDIVRRIGWPGAVVTLLIAGANITFVASINNTSVANTLVILASMPLFSALLGRLLIGETVKPRTRNSILLAIGGIAIIFSGSLGSGHWLGDVLAMATAFFQGLNLVILRKYKHRDLFTPALCLAGLITALAVLPLASPTQVPSGDIGLLMIMGFFIGPVSMTLFYGGARYAPATEIALLSLIETVLGPLWVWLVIGEAFGRYTLFGGALVILAVGGNAWFGILAERRKAVFT